VGEPQITFNYTKALSDFINNFTFGRGVSFRSPPETEAIVPSLLRRVWEVDNKKEILLWEMGNQGGVTGDCFVKVAYEEPWVDPAGGLHNGRIRILPLNSSYCFPEWHPHDRNRLLRFKLKYRFWGTAAEGTRQVFTYTELITDEGIEEYVNDELIRSDPNPLGTIPVVHIANIPVSGSPWGLADIHDVTSLNREYNEKATDISDIINYHAAPVTVITGAKASQLEKGPKKVWGGLPKDAQVFNLELGGNLAAPLEYLEVLKRAMHEMTGVPETALGEMQPISNTSGVALAIQYQPMMNRYNLKKTTYGQGLEKINELIIRTLAQKEPESLFYDPTFDQELKPEQVPQLDPSDPITYQTTTHWPPPLPVDILVKLNEIQAQMALGLQSKVGALRELGYEFPDEKMAEIFEELVEDAKRQGALDLLNGQMMQAIGLVTGVLPGMEEGGGVTSAGGSDVNSTGGGEPPIQPLTVDPDQQKLMAELVTKAYGTRTPQRRNPDTD
jgi:SPP1 Gp6-like portal protein